MGVLHYDMTRYTGLQEFLYFVPHAAFLLHRKAPQMPSPSIKFVGFLFTDLPLIFEGRITQ